jgi:hypothetical protein
MAEPEVDIFLGIVLELGGTVIPLEPRSAINKIRTEGITCALPPGQKIVLRSLGAALYEIFESLGTDPPEFLNSNGTIDETKVPADFLVVPLGLLASATLTVEDFYVKIPGSGSAASNPPTPTLTPTPTDRENTEYSIGVSATWAGDAGTLSSTIKLKLRGVYFKISNIPTRNVAAG